jgi:hypothetical protein
MNKLLVTSLVLITLLVRSYRLPQTFMFAEDQEDLGLRVKQIVVDRQPTLLSAKFSATGLYLPPGYLYGLIPFFLLTDFHPAAGMIVVVLLSGLTALFMFLAGGITAWALYTFWPLLHTWDRIFWNPNLILPASSLALLAILKNRPLLAAIASGIALQSHPQALMLALITLVYFRHHWPLILFILFLSISPLILFDLRHEFTLTRALLHGSQFTYRPYYLLFAYPFLILSLVWILSRFRVMAIIFLSLFLLKNVPAIFNQPDRPDSLVRKLSALSGTTSPHIQIQGSAEGFRYLIWYLSREKHTTPPTLYESWDNPPQDTAVIKL